MALVFSDDETMLVDSIKGFLARSAPVSAFRALRDAKDPKRFRPALWAEMVEMGIPGIFLDAELGGSAFSYAASGFVAEEIGRVLAAAPFHGTMLAVEILLRAGGQNELLTSLVDGSKLAAFAVDETPRHRLGAYGSQAKPQGAGFALTGGKRFVSDGGSADLFLVAAATESETVLLLVPREAAGLEVKPLNLVDSRDWADVTFSSVQLEANAVIAKGEAADVLIARALDLGRTLFAAELLGMAQEAFDRTTAYLKEREQFGVKIGSFQALQHRASRQYIALELTRSIVFKALREFDNLQGKVSDFASLAKYHATRTARHVLDEAVQMHGGIGVTDDLDIGLFLKRVRVAGEIFGDDSFHKEILGKNRIGV